MASSGTTGPSVDVDWGATGARNLADSSDVLVVVDVLSFSTSLSVAVERGAQVWPYAMGSDGAEQLAREIGAVLARGRSTRQGPTLSPASLLDLEEGSRIVLPSPSGSAIAHAAVSGGLPVVSACLRGAAAAVSLLAEFGRVGLVAAGERWPDGTLRPAYEDWLGCGVLALGLQAVGHLASPDAVAAAAAAGDPRPLADCPSGRELVERGFAADVELAEQRDVTEVVAVLKSGRFSAA
jgi:2-phosphosulfolactate phosphatase